MRGKRVRGERGVKNEGKKGERKGPPDSSL